MGDFNAKVGEQTVPNKTMGKFDLPDQTGTDVC